jgi:hypothetical protein
MKKKKSSAYRAMDSGSIDKTTWTKFDWRWRERDERVGKGRESLYLDYPQDCEALC